MDPVSDAMSRVCSIENCDAITGRCSAEGICICNWTYVGDDCATSIVDVYPGLKIYLYVHVAVFSALFLLIALAAGEGIRRLVSSNIRAMYTLNRLFNIRLTLLNLES